MKKKKVALITGVTGQDGSYLAEFLLNKGYIVHGTRRRSSLFNTERIDHLYNDIGIKEKKFFLHYADVTDGSNILNIIEKSRPDEIYNLAAQSHVHVSFLTPEYTANVDALGCLRILESMKILRLNKTKFYQASTSELYGDVIEIPQNEDTPFNPQSPYSIAKLYAYWITKNYRKSYDMFAVNGILFNHESPVRGETFVTRKITKGLCRIKLGLQECLYLGNIYAERDWGHAKDYAEAQWLILQHNKPEDFVISTGQMHSVKKFVELAAEYLEFKLEWKGKGENEVAIEKRTNKQIIAIDKKYFRPSEVNKLIGDSSKAKKLLGWSPKISFNLLVREMVDHDMKLLKNKK
jgi:GDPmannose 4,6-dehydratase